MENPTNRPFPLAKNPLRDVGKNPIRRHWMTIWMIGIGTVILWAVSFDPFELWSVHIHVPYSTPAAELSSTDLQRCLLIDGAYNDSRTVSGTVYNMCGRKLAYVQITYKLYDSSGALVGTALANQASIDVGEKWRFEANGFTTFKTFTLDSVSAR